MSKQRKARTWADVQADTRVASAFVDSDGVWIWLKPGWTADPLSAHDVHEDSKREAIARLNGVQPCHCTECERG